MQSGDRELRQNIRTYKQNGEAALPSTGVVADELLARELAHPGSDSRHGVNLVCCPPPKLIERIAAIQRRLSEFEPAQYYYPSQDLHLTLVEICHSRCESDAAATAIAVRSVAPAFLAQEQPATIDSPVLVSDARGAAINFLPCDDRLQKLRAGIKDHLALHGVVGDSRYPQQSAHVTILRYIQPLRTPVATWLDVMNRCQIVLNDAWELDEVWLTWGATWYGMLGRIQRVNLKKGPA